MLFWAVMLVVGVLLSLALFVWALVRAGQDENVPVPPAKPKRAYLRGLCPYCGELDVVLRQDGEPSRRHHPCVAACAVDVLPSTWPSVPPEGK